MIAPLSREHRSSRQPVQDNEPLEAWKNKSVWESLRESILVKENTGGDSRNLQLIVRVIKLRRHPDHRLPSWREEDHGSSPVWSNEPSRQRE